MKKMILSSAFLLLLCAGCATSVCRHYPDHSGRKTASGKEVVASIKGRNYGYFLFYSIPLWCGAPYHPNESDWRLWRNLVRERDIRRMLVARSQKLKADDIEEYVYREKSSGLWSLGIIWHRSITGECLAVRKPGKKVKKSLLKIK